MAVQRPENDLPRGNTGASDLWDDPTAGVLLRNDYFEPRDLRITVDAGTFSLTGANTALQAARLLVLDPAALDAAGAEWTLTTGGSSPPEPPPPEPQVGGSWHWTRPRQSRSHSVELAAARILIRGAVVTLSTGLSEPARRRRRAAASALLLQE